MNEFYSLADTFQHNLTQLRNGNAEQSYHRISDGQTATRMLSRASEHERILRSKTFLDGLEYRQNILQGMHDRGEAFLFAAHALETERDASGIRNHVPIYLRAISIPHKIVKAHEVWDLTMSAHEWGVNERQEMYNVVNIGTLILEPGAQVIVRGNALSFCCQELHKPGHTTGEYDIGILGTPHGFGKRQGNFEGKAGRSGKNGQSGTDGVHPQVSNGLAGETLVAGFQSHWMNGTDGSLAESGQDGEYGLNGGACRITEITIRKLLAESPLTVGVIAGDGGNGGHGGAGGNGGDGGNAGYKQSIKGEIKWSGKGGKGGHAGHGGHGGRGGHSGLTSNVFITLPQDQTHLLNCFSRAGKPGHPGKGGEAGKPGLGGLEPGSPEGRAAMGNPGKAGRDGRPGRQLPPAKLYVNGVWREGSIEY